MNVTCGWMQPHPEHSWGDGEARMEWCPGSFDVADDSDHSLLDALDAALVANGTKKVCPACDVIENAGESVRGPLADALAGTIGRDKLVQILRAHGHDVSRRVIERHRQEGHTAT